MYITVAFVVREAEFVWQTFVRTILLIVSLFFSVSPTSGMETHFHFNFFGTNSPTPDYRFALHTKSLFFWSLHAPTRDHLLSDTVMPEQSTKDARQKGCSNYLRVSCFKLRIIYELMPVMPHLGTNCIVHNVNCTPFDIDGFTGYIHKLRNQICF